MPARPWNAKNSPMRLAQQGKLHSAEAVRLEAREACAQIADLVARRRYFAGDDVGAGVASDIARLIREDQDMGEG